MRSESTGTTSSAKEFLVGQVWLIKSGEKILGPFTSNEVIEKLRSKEVMIIDEVNRPLSRWRVIRDEPIFRDIVEEVRRAQMDTREATEIQGHTSQVSSSTITDHGVEANSQRPSDRPEISVVIESASTDPSSAFAIDQNEVKDAEFTEDVSSSAQNRKSKASVRQYGVSASKSAKKELGFFQVAIWVLAVAAVGAAGWMFLRDSASTEKAATAADLGAILANADSSWERGEFDAALALYRQANHIKAGQPEVIARLAPLLIHIDAQTTAAKREINEALSKMPLTADPKLRGLLQTSLGLAALSSDDNAEAQEQFHLAIDSAPDFAPSAFDMAITAYLRATPASMREAFARFVHASTDTPSQLMTALTAISVQAGSKSQAVGQANSALEILTSRSQDYLQEAFVASAMLKVNAGDKAGATQQIRQALDTDPDMTAEHWHSPYLYLEPLGWNQFVPYCQKLNGEINTPLSRSLLALCLFKSGSREKASEVLIEALAVAPEDALLQSVNAYTLASTDRFEDARGALKLATQKSAPRLALLVQARVCAHSGDTACAEKAYRDLLQTAPPMIAAYVGLAEIQQRAGKATEAQEWIAKAKALSPSYRPVLNFAFNSTAATPTPSPKP